jgi:hypothetical protein
MNNAFYTNFVHLGVPSARHNVSSTVSLLELSQSTGTNNSKTEGNTVKVMATG